jgi:hypothetical protein
MKTSALLIMTFFGIAYGFATVHTSPASVRMRIINESGCPTKIVKAVIENDTGREISQIRYTLKNDTRRNLRAVFVRLVFLNPTGGVLGGEEFREMTKLRPGHQTELVTPLKHYAADGATVGITVSTVESEDGTWRGGNASALLQKTKQE